MLHYWRAAWWVIWERLGRIAFSFFYFICSVVEFRIRIFLSKKYACFLFTLIFFCNKKNSVAPRNIFFFRKRLDHVVSWEKIRWRQYLPRLRVVVVFGHTHRMSPREPAGQLLRAMMNCKMKPLMKSSASATSPSETNSGLRPSYLSRRACKAW